MQAQENACIVVLVTVGSRDEGERLAAALVSESLAACVNLLGPMRSVYRWEGTLHNDEELLLIIKSRACLFDALRMRVQELHSYQTPEVIALPITDGSPGYLAWLRAETSPRSPQGH
jgi:periplasmic divalent cation tolerance protein